MNKKIIFGSIFSICIIMLVNTASAIEYQTINKNEQMLESDIKIINNLFTKITQASEGLKIETIDEASQNEIKEISEQLNELKASILNNPSNQVLRANIISLLLSLMFSLIGTFFGIIFGRILGSLLVLTVRILTAPIVLLAKIIEFIVNLFTP